MRALWRRKLRPAWKDYQWAVIGGMIIGTIIIGGIYLGLQLFYRKSASVNWSLSACLVAVKLLATAVSPFITIARALRVIFRQQIQAIRIKIYQQSCRGMRNGRNSLIVY